MDMMQNVPPSTQLGCVGKQMNYPECRGWEDGSESKVLSAQVLRPELEFLEPIENLSTIVCL